MECLVRFYFLNVIYDRKLEIFLRGKNIDNLSKFKKVFYKAKAKFLYILHIDMI